ncbi:TRAP transporter substrate-binding protein DctP [Pelomicrobium methylotrophicum]|uniref:ABC transporter substrate-binding protein n=1 Tax=Pelomicrobium methylotrophicum TaxID=2602750 RepID=A0A5C7EWC7_9PROT|nr:TRAP transporter substrate-binding protein DctP [Pelomicrobium methylotrophicum]TXF13305.1 ABC transporter substrate-binding protein [Pelomicrobium methylotrophicum]
MKLMHRLLGLFAAGILAAGPAAAQEIKISHQFKAETDGRDRAARLFVKEVNKRDPSIKFRIYPGQSLGIKPVAQLDALQAGTLEMAVYPMSYAVGKIPEFSIFIMPGVINNLDQAMKLKGTKFHELVQKIAEDNGVHIVTWWWTPGGFATKSREITGPESVKGLSMRAADPTFEAMLKAAGASVTAMASTEIYPALQSGVLDGALTSAESFVSMRLYEQTKHATVGGEYNLWMLMQPLLMSKKAWDALTPAQKKAFQEAADISDEFFLKLQREATDKMAETFSKAGAKVRQMTKAEYDAWVELAKKTSWVEYQQKAPRGKELLQLAIDATK